MTILYIYPGGFISVEVLSERACLFLYELYASGFSHKIFLQYSHLFNKRGAWNKRGGGVKVAKSLNVEVGINVEGGIFCKKLVHISNKRGVEGGKNLRNQ